jgi:hypothetical protein
MRLPRSGSIIVVKRLPNKTGSSIEILPLTDRLIDGETERKRDVETLGGASD